MRVLHLIRSLKKAGAEKICVDICTELSKREDVQVLLVSMSSENAFEKLTKNIPFKIINSKVFPSITGKSNIETKEYEVILDDFKPDIVHSHLFWSELLAKQCLRDNITYVSHCHDNMREFDNFKLDSVLSKMKLTALYEKRWILKRMKKCKNHFLTISKDTTDYFNNVLPREMRNIYFLPNAINVKTYSKPENYKKKNKTLKLINVGRFAKYKNQQFLIDVAKELDNRNVKFKMYLAGEGTELNNVKLKAKNLKTQSVVFLGNIDNVQNYFWESDIYLHSATYEPFGLVLIEAMAAGLPVLTTNGKGNVDVMENDKNGYILPQNVHEFCNKINELSKSKAIYSRVSKYCIEYSKKFDIVNYTDRLVFFYNQILNKRT
jgi:glycosyltransferase involved in cell wall biosynthesis